MIVSSRHTPAVVAMMTIAGARLRRDGRFEGEGSGGRLDTLLACYTRIETQERRDAVEKAIADIEDVCRNAECPPAPTRDVKRLHCAACERRVRGWTMAAAVSLTMWGAIALIAWLNWPR